jgi:predicted metal-dependent hydrolase
MSLDELRRTISSESAFTSLQITITEMIDRNLESIQTHMNSRDITTAKLAIRSRRAYQWILFLGQKDNLLFHLDALQRVNLYLPSVLPDLWKSVQISFYHQGALYKISQKNRIWELKIQESFIHAPDTVLTAMLKMVKAEPDPELQRTIRDHTFNEGYRKIRENLEYLDIPSASFASGHIHHLAESFARVNQTYFRGKLSRPHLTWNNRLTHRKFGHYQWDTDTVMISKSLDQPAVPELVLDYVMYHELLHKELGALRGNKNRIAHTREFRLKEGKFKNFSRAKKGLNKIARKQARS